MQLFFQMHRVGPLKMFLRLIGHRSSHIGRAISVVGAIKCRGRKMVPLAAKTIGEQPSRGFIFDFELERARPLID